MTVKIIRWSMMSNDNDGETIGKWIPTTGCSNIHMSTYSVVHNKYSYKIKTKFGTRCQSLPTSENYFEAQAKYTQRQRLLKGL